MPNSNFMSDANATAIFTAYASAIKLGLKAWVGTTAEWDQLTDAQKKQYQVNFKTDDCSGESIEAIKKSIADDFSINVNYSKGEYCYHLGDLYKFTSDHTAGAWSSADVEQVQVCDEIGELKNTLTANTFVDGVLLVSGTPYTCPTDGYVNVYIPTGAEIVVWINSAANFDVKNTSGTGNYHLLYVKKGMIIKATFSNGSVTFRGLIN